jgi:hypothetical protein
MKYIQVIALYTWLPLALWGLIAYQLGQSSVRMTTVVRSGEPYYQGLFYGKCAWSGEPGRSYQFCATDQGEKAE